MPRAKFQESRILSPTFHGAKYLYLPGGKCVCYNTHHTSFIQVIPVLYKLHTKYFRRKGFFIPEELISRTCDRGPEYTQNLASISQYKTTVR